MMELRVKNYGLLRIFPKVLVASVICLLLGSKVLFAASAKEASGTIKFWHVWDGPRFALIDKQVSEFQALYPKIKVIHSLVDPKTMHEKYLTAIAGGDPPDIIMLRSGEIPAFAGRKALIPLDDYIARERLNLEEIFYSGEIQTQQYQGKTYGLPVVVGGARFMLFWNKDIFKEVGLDPEKPPKTWQELTVYAEKLMIKKGPAFERIGFNPLAAGAIPPSTAFRMWLYTNNGKFYSDDGKKVMFNSKEGLETLKWLVNLVDRIAGKYENLRMLAGPTRETTRAAFYGGKLAMYNEGNWNFFVLAKEAPKLNYGAAELPYNGENPKAKSIYPNEGSWGYCMPRGVKNPDAAWVFIKYTTAEEGNLKFCIAQKRPSPVRKFNEDPELSKDNPYWHVVMKTLENTVFVPYTPIDLRMREVMTTMEEDVLYHKKTPEEALEWGAKQVQKLLDDWYEKHPE